MRVWVTGGAGYIGCVLVPMLLDAGYRVRVLDNLRKGGLGLLHCFADPGLDFVRGDIRDPEAVKQALRDVDIIIHLAAVVGYPACQKDPWLAREVNVGGTLNLLRHRSPQQLIIFPSSLSNYGNVSEGVCTEEMEPTPITLYGVTKLEAERLLLEHGGVTIFRPATAFGLSPQMRLDLLLNDFVYRALKEKQVVVYEPHYVRAFIHVRDFARAFLFVIQNADKMMNQVYNLGAESLNLTKGEVAQRIRQRIDFDLRLSNKGEDPDKRNYRADFSKLRALGYRVEVTIEQGIEELVRGLQVIDVVNPFANVTYV